MSRRLFTLLILFPFALLSSEITLIENGTPKVRIVIASDAPQSVRYAAEELRTHLKQRTGAEIPLSDDTAVPADGLLPFCLGISKMTHQLGIQVGKTGPDGYFLAATEKYVVIAGHDAKGNPPMGIIHPLRAQEAWNPGLKLAAFGEVGTLNGVYRFLEEYAGIRWYMPGELGTVIPKNPTLKIPETVKNAAPDFEYRYAWFCNFPDAPRDAVWYRRAGFGAPFPVTITHNYVVMRKYKDSHPEYFALIGGKRDFTNLSTVGGGNYCLSNPGLFKAWVDFLCDYFAKNPAQKLYPLCPMDGMTRICECPDCQKQLSPHLGNDGKFSNYVWNFSARVARAVAEKYPDRMIGTFAYEGYRNVPEIADFPENLAVMICYERQRMRDPEFKKKIRTLIDAWRKKTSSLYFWNYPIFDYWLPFRGFPVLYPDLLQEDLRYQKKIGARGAFLESEFHMPNDAQVKAHNFAFPGLAHLNTYLRIKLMWNTELSVRALLDEYYRLFYGPAEQTMRRFWTLAEKAYMAKASDHPVKQYTNAQLREFRALLEQAVRETPAGSIWRKRVELIRSEMTPYVDRLLNLVGSKRAFEVPLLSEPFRPGRNIMTPFWMKSECTKLVAKDGSAASFDTLVYGAANRRGLALMFLNFEPEMDKIKTATHTRDTGEVWNDDNVEVFLYTADASRGIQYILTAAGNIWDAGLTAGNPPDTAWNGRAETFVWKGPDRWFAQIFIPWSDLGITLAEASKLKLNLYRTRCTKVSGGEFAAYSPTMTHQHNRPEFFAPLVIRGKTSH